MSRDVGVAKCKCGLVEFVSLGRFICFQDKMAGRIRWTEVCQLGKRFDIQRVGSGGYADGFVNARSVYCVWYNVCTLRAYALRRLHQSNSAYNLVQTCAALNSVI